MLADWDTDGKLDLAVTDLSGVVGLVFGQGNGDFADNLGFRAGVSPGGNSLHRRCQRRRRSGWSATASGGAPSIYSPIGNGNHGFTRAVTFDAVKKPNAVAVGDLNGDGFLDVVTANTADDSV